MSSSSKSSSSTEAIEKGNWFTHSLNKRSFFKGWIELPKDNSPWAVAFVAILMAYLLSFWVRLEWIDFAQAHFTNEEGEVEFIRPNMVQDGVALANTHDSFYFGTIVQKAALGRHQNNSLIPDVYQNGMITALPYWLIQAFPSLTIEQLLLWLPVYIAGLVCIPIVLIGRLYGSTVLGFGAACLAGVTHSYYNRTLAGYYDTDIFAITSPAFSVFFLLAASRKQSIGYLVAASISMLLGRFFYGSLQSITCSIALCFIFYHILISVLQGKFSFSGLGSSEDDVSGKQQSSLFSVLSVILMGWVLYAESWSAGSVIDVRFGLFLFGILFPVFVYGLIRFLFKRYENKFSLKWEKALFGVAIINIFLLLLGVLPFFEVGPYAGTVSKVLGKLQSYSVVGKTGSTLGEVSALQFLDVKTTIREASKIPFDVVRNRILADTPTCSCPRCMPQGIEKAGLIIPSAIIGLAGLILMILRYWEFCIVLPFLAIAYNCFEGNVGLRFTVHVGNYAAIGLVFLLLVILWGVFRYLQAKWFSVTSYEHRFRWGAWITTFFFVSWFAFPNLNHAAKYHSHVVYPKKTMEVLQKLNDASDPDDFVVTWWDYGSGCWFYGDTRTFTSPAHQTFDNFLSSEILRSTSVQRAVNLSRLKTETYKNLSKSVLNGEDAQYSTAVQAIFQDGKKDHPLYQSILYDAQKEDFPLPAKTQETFLFLPYEILRIFPTILSFSSRNLYFAGNEGSNAASLKEPPMMILRNGRREGVSMVFDGGYRLDNRGYLVVDSQNQGVISYGQVFEVDEGGGQAKIISSLQADGLNIGLRNDPTNGRRLFFLPQRRDLLIVSADTFRSTFVRRFLLNNFDANAYDHPSFVEGANPRKQPFFTQADWVSSQGSKIFLNMRGGYKIEADLSDLRASLPNSQEKIPFSFHRKIHHETTGQLIDVPSQENPDAKFHLVQTTLPNFIGDREYIIPNGGESLIEIAKNFGVKSLVLSSYNGVSLEHKFQEGESIKIPGKGYQLGQAWFFMDQEAFDSVLVRGYFMENLDPKFFEKIYATTWGKVYKFKSN